MSITKIPRLEILAGVTHLASGYDRLGDIQEMAGCADAKPFFYFLTRRVLDVPADMRSYLCWQSFFTLPPQALRAALRASLVSADQLTLDGLPTRDILNWAAKCGDESLVRVLLNDYNITPDKSTLDAAAGSKNVALVRLFLEEPYNLAPDGTTLCAAAKQADRETFHLLTHEPYRLSPDGTTLNAGIKSGSYSFVQHLTHSYDLRLPPTRVVLVLALGAALQSNDLELACSIGQAYINHPDQLPAINNLLTIPARRGNVIMLQCFLNAPYNLTPNKETLDAAAGSGSIEAIQLLLDRPYNLRPDKMTLDNATASGNPDAVELFLNEPYNIRPDKETLDTAAQSGNLDLIASFLEEPYNFIPDKRTLDSAAISGNPEALSLFLNQPYNLPTDMATLNAAAASGKLEPVLILMEEHHLHPNFTTFEAAPQDPLNPVTSLIRHILVLP